MAESTSKLRAQVKALTNVNGSGGVDILADEKTFRSTYDIMSDIADVWSGMSDIDQSALLELLAGKVRSNQVAALLSNFDQAEAALKTSQNAEGTMDKVHRAWMDSVEARKAQFEAAQEALSMTVMPANTLKGLYQTGTSALGLLNTVIGATSPVGFGAGVFGVANALRSGGGSIAAGLGNITGYHRDMFNGGKLTRGDLGFVNAYNEAFSQTGDKQAAFNRAISQTNKQLDSYTMSLYSNTSGMIDASKVTKSFGSQIVSFAKNAAVGLATFGAMEAAAFIANQAWQWFDSNVLHRGETLANNAASAYADYEQAQSKAVANTEAMTQAQTQLDQLRSKENRTPAETSEMVSLESQMRAMALQQQLLDMQTQRAAQEALRGWDESYTYQQGKKSDASEFYEGLARDTLNAYIDDLFAQAEAPGSSDAIWAQYQRSLNAKRMFEEGGVSRDQFPDEASYREEADRYQAILNEAKAAGYDIGAQSAEQWYRTQSKVSGKERQEQNDELNASVANIWGQIDAFGRLTSMITSGDYATAELLEQYATAKAAQDQIRDSLNSTSGAVEAIGDDAQQFENNWGLIQDAMATVMFQQTEDARMALTSYAGTGFHADAQLVGNVGHALQDYLATYQALQDGNVFDAINSLLPENGDGPLQQAIQHLAELSAAGKLTTDSLKEMSETEGLQPAVDALSAVLALAGVSFDRFVSDLNARTREAEQNAGRQGGTAAAKVDTYGDRKTSVAGVFAAQDTGEKLWSSSGFSGTMTMDDYEHMMALDDGAYQAAIQYANGGLFFNKDVFDKLVQQKYREELNGLRKDVADTQKKYAEAAERLTAQAEKKRTGAADFDEMAMNAANDDLQTAAKELAGYRAMQAMIQNGMTGYANWVRNKSGPEMGDMYDELGVAAQAILSGKQSGKVGTRQFEAAMRWYTGQENFDVNKLTKRDWSLLRGAAGVDSTGKAVEGLPQKTVDGVLKDLQAIGVLGDHLEVLDKNMTAEKMSALYNKAYNANTDGEFMTGVFMAKNDTIQNPANKYTFGSGEDPEQAAMQDAAREFAKIAKDFKEGKVTADALLAAAGKLDEATNNALQTTGTEDAQKQAEEMVDAKTQADTLASIDKSLSNLVDISQQQLDVQTGKQSTTKDDNAGGGQGGAGGEGGAGAETEETQAGGVNGYNKYLAAMAEHNKRPTGSGTTTDPRDSLNALLDSEAALDAFGELSGEALNQWRGYQEAAEQAAAEGDIPALIQNMSALGRMIAETNKATAEQRSQAEQERQKAEEQAAKAAEQAAEAQAKEDQRNRLLEAATPDAVAAIEDQQSQATARGKAEKAARKALEEEAAAAENALRETNAQRYGEAYDKAMTSPDIDHGGPGQKALEQAFDQIGAAFEAGDWEAFEAAMQNLDQVTAAVAAADQERRDREQQESDDRAAGEALQARLEEQQNADIAAGQAHAMTEDEIDALYDRGDAVVDDIQDFVNSNLDGNEQLSAAGMELNNALRGLSSEVSPEQLAGMIDNAQKMLDEARGLVETQGQGGAAAGQEETQPELADNVALQAGSVTMPDLSQVSANGNVDLNARPQISGQQMLAAGWQEFAENLGDYATLFSSTSTGGGMTSLATPIGANGTVYSPNDFFNYLDWLHGTSSSAADMINRDNPNNGGLGLLISAIDGESEETIQAMDQLGQQLSQSQAEMYGQAGDVDLQADNVNVGTTPDNLPQPAAGAQEPTQQAKEPVDTTSSASVEPEIPSTNKEVSVDTKSATITLPSGSIGISSELRSQGQSALFGLEDSSYAMGMRPGGEALSPAEVQAVNNAINSLSQALTGDDAQALASAMGTATQIMQGNIAVSPSATEAVQSGSGSGGGGGGGQAPVTQATVQVTAETPEIPTPEAPSVTIPVTAEEADIPTPAVPSVVIPVSYGDPGSLSVEQPAGVTIPVAWGDPGPAPGGGGGVTLSAPMAAASGTDNARGGTTLVDELGAELIEHRSRGTYELGTDRGARFTKLDPGDIVHNAKETSKILQRGKAMWRGGVETGRAAALTKNVNALSKADIGGGARKTNYTFSADNITINATPGKSIQDGYVSSSAGDDRYKWLTSPEHAMQQAMQEHSNIQHGLSANIDKETGERIGKEFLEWLKKLIDWIPTYLSVLKKKTTAFINATDDAIHYLSKNQLLDDAIGNVAEEIKANMQAVMRYQDFLNEMAGKGFSQDIIDKIQNGTIDIKEYADEDTVKSIQAYQEYWNKLVACREALQSLNAQMEALSAQKLEHVVDYFDRIDSLLRDQQKTFESLLSMKKQYGEELKVTDYVDSLQTMEQVLANAQNEETALIQELKDQLGVDGDLVNAILKGGREVWDTIAEHVKKNTYSIVEDVKPEVQEAYAESRKNAQKEEETSKKQASTFTINGTTYYKTSSGKFRSMTNGSYITASAAKQAIQTQQEVAEETKPEDLDFSITDVPVTPITDEEIIELGEKLGMVMTDGSEEALANFETIKSLLTTSWEHPLAIGSDTWYEYMSTLERLRESIYSTKTEIGELKDEMADIPLTNLKTGFDYLEEIQRNLEDMNSLLDAQGSAKYEDTYRSLISVGMKQIENLQEQNKLIQEQMNGLDPLSEKYQELRSNLNGNLDTIADIRKSQEEWNDEIIDLQIERLRKQNDSYKEQLRLMEAMDDLDKARQRRLLIYHEDTGFQYEADEDELESAQEAANDAIFNNIISDLEKSKADSNIYGPLGERLISGSSILDSLGNVLVPVEDKLSGLDFEPYYQSIVSGSEQSGLLEGLLQSIDLSKLLEASIGGNVNIDIGTMTLNEVQNAKDLGDAIINQLPSYLLQALYKKGAN